MSKKTSTNHSAEPCVCIIRKNKWNKEPCTHYEHTRLNIECLIVNSSGDRIIVMIGAFPIKEHSIRHSKVLASIKGCSQILPQQEKFKKNSQFTSLSIIDSSCISTVLTCVWWSYTHFVTPCIPVTNKDCEISTRSPKGNGNHYTIVHNNSSKASCCPLKVKGREVKEATNLILCLKTIGPVPSYRNGAIGPRYTILPGVSSIL